MLADRPQLIECSAASPFKAASDKVLYTIISTLYCRLVKWDLHAPDGVFIEQDKNVEGGIPDGGQGPV